MLAVSFWTWVLWKGAKQEGLAKARRAVQHMRQRQLAGAWLRWQEFAAEAAAQRGALMRALGHWRHAQLGAALRQWATWTRGRQSKLDSMEHAVLFWRHQALGSALVGWHFRARDLSRKRENATLALLHWRNMRKAVAFFSWEHRARVLVSKRESAIAAITFWLNLCLGSAFAGWQLSVEETARKRHKVALAVKLWRNRTLASAFAGWAARVSELICKQAMASRALTFWQNLALGHAWAGWLHRVSELAAKRESVHRALSSWRAAALRRAFNALAANVVARAKAAAALERWAHSAAARAVDGWRDVVRKQRAALWRWRHSALGKALASWRVWAATSGYHRSVLVRCVARMRAAALSRAFDGWAAAWEAGQEAGLRAEEIQRRVVGRMTEQSLWAAFSTLVEHRRQRQAARAILSRVRQRGASLALNSWLLYCEQQDKMRDLLRRVLCGLKEAAFFNWRLAAEESIYERQSQEFIEELVLSNPELGDRAWLSLLRWGGLLKATSLEKWMDYASRSRDLRHKMEVVVRRHWLGLTRRSLLALMANAERRGAKKRRLQVALRFWCGKGTALAFRHWRLVADELIVERLAVVRSIYAYARQLKLRGLSGWRQEAAYQQWRRAQLASALAHMSAHTARSAFSVWRGMARELGALRRRLGALVRRVAGRWLRAAWGGWVNVLDWRAWLAECHAAALRKFVVTTGRKALWAWRQQAATQARHAAIAAHCLARRNRFAAASCFYAWIDVIQAVQKLRAATHQMITGMLGRAFDKWYTTWRHERIRRLIAGKLLGCLRRGFEAWLEAARLRAAKRAAFARRQAAIQRALAYGDALAWERRRELVLTCLCAWRLQAGRFQLIRKRLAEHCTALKRAAFAEWAAVMRDHAVAEMQASADRMAAMFRLSERREALRVALAVINEADEVQELASRFRRWAKLVRVLARADARAEGLFAAKQRRRLWDFMALWAGYCRAMNRDQPLERCTSHALEAVRHMAEVVSPGRSDGSAAALQLARAVSPTRSRGHPAGVSGSSYVAESRWESRGASSRRSAGVSATQGSRRRSNLRSPRQLQQASSASPFRSAGHYSTGSASSDDGSVGFGGSGVGSGVW
eukprot:jgi/Tetstr1/461688/TSEL_006788.t1